MPEESFELRGGSSNRKSSYRESTVSVTSLGRKSAPFLQNVKGRQSMPAIFGVLIYTQNLQYIIFLCM